MSDSFMSDIGALSLFIGTGAMIAKTAEEVRVRGTVTSRWESMHQADSVLDKVEAAKFKRTPLKYGQVEEVFRLARLEWNDLDHIVSTRPNEVDEDALRAKMMNIDEGESLVRSNLLDSLIHSFKLQETEAARSLDLQGLMEMSPLHTRHVESVLSNYGLLDDTPGFAKGERIGQRGIANRFADLGASVLFDDATTRVLTGTDPALNNIRSISDGFTTSIFENPEALAKALRESNPGREDLEYAIQRATDLGERLNKKSMPLGGRFLDGKLVGIFTEIGDEQLNIPIMQEGNSYIGRTHTERYTGRRAMHPNVADYTKGGKGAFWQRPDTLLMDHLGDNLESFQSDPRAFNRTIKGLVGDWKTNQSQLFMPESANKMLNLRADSELATDISIGPKLNLTWREALDQRLLLNGNVIIEGIKADSWAGGVRRIVANTAIPGLSIFGQGVSADKEVAQRNTMRRVVSTGSDARYTFNAYETGLLSGTEEVSKVTPRIGSYSMPESHLRAIFEGFGRPNLYPIAEDTAVIFGRRPVGEYQANIHIPFGTQQAVGLDQVINPPLEDLPGAIPGSHKIPILAPGTKLGFNKDGTVISVSEQGKFEVSGVFKDMEKQRLTISGHYMEELGDGHKTFGFKRTWYSGLSEEMGRYAAAIHEVGTQKGYTGERLEDFLRRTTGEVMKNFTLSPSSTFDEALGALPQGLREQVLLGMERNAAVQALDTQGIKRVQERGLDVLAESLLADIGEQAARRPDGAKMIASANAIFADQGISMELMDYNGRLQTEIDVDGTQGKYNIVERSRRIILASSNEAGINGRWNARRALMNAAGGNTVLKKRIKGFSRQDIFVLTESLLNGNLSPSAQALLDGVDGVDPLAIQKSIYSYIGDSGGALRYGRHTHAFAMGGAARDQLGAGGRGSFASAGLDHLRAQGGVMGDIADEISGRLLGGDSDVSAGIHKRIAAFSIGGDPTLSAEEAATALGNKNMIGALTSRNQQERDEAFRRIGKSLGMDPDAIGKFNEVVVGTEGGKGIYLERQAGVLSGPYVTDQGVEVKTPMDRALSEYLKGTLMDNDTQRATAMSSYEKALAEAATGPESPLAKQFSGKTLGSIQLDAAPNTFTSLRGRSVVDAVGVRESKFEKMGADLQWGRGERMLALLELREGTHAGLTGRHPNADMHRVTGTRFFSIDEAVKADIRATAALITDSLPEAERASAYAKYLGVNKGLSGQDLIEYTALNSESSVGKLTHMAIDDALQLYPEDKVLIPKSIEATGGIDYDGDPIHVALVKDRKLRRGLLERVTGRDILKESFAKTYPNSGFDDVAKFLRAGEGSDLFKLAGSAAIEDFTYHTYLSHLYQDVLKGYKPDILGPEDVGHSTERAKKRIVGQMAAAHLEKAEVGPLTNITNFVRDTLRETDDVFKMTQGRIFGEMLLGLLPEVVLKARQPGAIGLVEKQMQENILTIRNLMSNKGDVARLSMDEKVARFEDAFRSIYRPEGSAAGAVDELLAFVPRILQAAESNVGDKAQNALARLLKSERPTAGGEQGKAAMKQVVDLLSDPTNPSLIARSFQRRAGEIGVEGGSKMKTNIKNVKATFGDIIDIMKRNKTPALIGLGVALGASLLSTPTSISADEADAAGARHSRSGPSPEDPNFGDSAPVAVGSGRTVRIRGSSNGDIDANEATRRLREHYPGADVSYKMQDYREKMNEDYLHKRLMR